MDFEPRTTLPLATSRCSCCSPAARAPKVPAAVVPSPKETPDAGASSAALPHLSQHSG